MMLPIIVVLSVAVTTHADFACVCSNTYEVGIHEKPQTGSPETGYIYADDCKQRVTAEGTWIVVVYNHKIGYVIDDSRLLSKTCVGSPSDPDLLTTKATTTITTTQTSTTQVTTSTPTPTTAAVTTSTAASTTSTTTPKPATTTPKPATITPKPATTTAKPTTKITTPKPTTTTTPKPTTTTTPKPTTTTTPKPTTTTTPKPTTTTTPKPTTTTTTTPKPSTTTTPKPTTTTTPKPTTTTTTPKPTTTTTPKPTTTTPKPTTTTQKATTTTPIPTTSTTPKPTTLKPTTTTKTTTRATTTTKTYKPTTHKVVTHAPMATHPSSSSPCYNTYRYHSSQVKGTLTSNGEICYEFETANATWIAAENDCTSKGGHLAHIANVQEQNFINNFLNTHYNHRVWIGLHDRQREEHFQWSSGSPVTYTHWSPDRYNVLHILTDCVELDPTDSGFWKDKDCDTFRQFHFGYVCQYGGSSGIHFTFTHAPTTHAPVNHFPFTHPTVHQSGSDGNTNLCLFKHRQHSQKYGTILAQHGSSCYELMPTQRMSWQHAETLCETGGGHLATIRSSAEQTFIQGFMMRHLSDRAVWIGLHDLNREGHYEWTSGNWVSYTNFIPGHLSNYYSRYDENCFVLIPYKSGYWDDIPCGRQGFNSDYGEIHPPLCQFPTSSVSFIG